MEQDTELIKRAVKGKPGAFEALMETYKAYLYRMAYLYCREEHTALDIVSETVAKAYVGIRKLKKPEYFKTWLTRILIREALKAKEKSARVISLERMQEAGESFPCPEEGAYSREEIWDVQSAVARLPQDMQILVILKYFQEFTTREISELTGSSEGAVRTQLCRARKLLREDLTAPPKGCREKKGDAYAGK